MAIVKMKAVTIAAQISEFDTVVEKYVYGRDIHLENAMSVISNRGKLKNFEENNEYDIVAKNALSIMNLANYTVNKKLIAPESVKLGDMQNFIDGINERIEEERNQSDELSERIKANEAAVEQQYNNQLTYYENMFSSYGFTMESYAEMIGQTEDEFKETLHTAAENAIKQQLLIDAVAEKEGLTVEDADRESLAENYGTDLKTLQDTYGEDMVDQTALIYKVVEFIGSNAVVK